MREKRTTYVLPVASIVILALLGIVILSVAIGNGGLYGSHSFGASAAQTPYGAAPQATTGNAVGFITVSATGMAYGIPTESQFSLYINGTGTTAQQATQSFAQTLNAFNSTIVPYINGNQTLIQTTSYNLYKVYNKTVYQATESVSVTLPNIKNTSVVLGALSAIPNVFVSGVSAILAPWQVGALRDQALSAALANATNQAEVLAGTGATLHQGNITVSTFNYYPIYSASFVPSAVAGAQPTPNFYSGRSAVMESLTTQFAYSR